MCTDWTFALLPVHIANTGNVHGKCCVIKQLKAFIEIDISCVDQWARRSILCSCRCHWLHLPAFPAQATCMLKLVEVDGVT